MPKILIVDDSLFMRNRLTKLLTEHEYETVTAGDGVEAVRVYKEARPDAVLMDITMPRKDGLEALAEIRSLDFASKVVMLTENTVATPETSRLFRKERPIIALGLVSTCL